MQGILIGQVLYHASIATTKFSILFLYQRIFPSRRFRFVLWGVGIFVACYSATAAIATLLSCLPIEANWDLTVPDTCVDAHLEIVILGSINVLTDVVVLCLPMPLVWRLQTSRIRKLQVSGLFLLGGLYTIPFHSVPNCSYSFIEWTLTYHAESSVCIVSVIRTIYIGDFTSKDASCTVAPLLLAKLQSCTVAILTTIADADSHAISWSIVETCIGVVSACLPTMRPLYNRVFRHDKTVDMGGSAEVTQGYTSYHRAKMAHSPATKLSTFAPTWPRNGDLSKSQGSEVGSFTRLADRQDNGNRP